MERLSDGSRSVFFLVVCSPRHTSFIHGVNVTDVIVTGNNGTIDGRGQVCCVELGGDACSRIIPRFQLTPRFCRGIHHHKDWWARHRDHHEGFVVVLPWTSSFLPHISFSGCLFAAVFARVPSPLSLSLFLSVRQCLSSSPNPPPHTHARTLLVRVVISMKSCGVPIWSCPGSHCATRPSGRYVPGIAVHTTGTAAI